MSKISPKSFMHLEFSICNICLFVMYKQLAYTLKKIWIMKSLFNQIQWGEYGHHAFHTCVEVLLVCRIHWLNMDQIAFLQFKYNYMANIQRTGCIYKYTRNWARFAGQQFLAWVVWVCLALLNIVFSYESNNWRKIIMLCYVIYQNGSCVHITCVTPNHQGFLWIKSRISELS